MSDPGTNRGAAARRTRREAPGPQVPEPAVAAHLDQVGVGGLGALVVDAADLTGLDLAGAELAEVQVEASALDRLHGAGGRWRGVTLVDCRLDGADLANLRAQDLSLVRCSLREVRLTGAQLAGARLRAVRLDGARASLTSWREAVWQHVVLRGCDLTEADLTGASLSDVLLVDCDLSGAQLAGLRCERVRLEGCRLSGISGVGGLRGASVTEADAYALLPTLLREAGLTVHG
ncbi:pentapeptide repeat-containing protein [Georgenia muralis]|uniref:Uncharacterized protein YjbI with pentapeptide repeats n=1 Tax=Georgenia muralis TaxID=154117 RepID=A0A3N5A1C0_9MICO|nr:pentapeptide repeat-containing protein [Georgenia muralis]RPF25681.1 uncharacterized protein YjbI with pentapeptide repeats [Georgenia muralis]